MARAAAQSDIAVFLLCERLCLCCTIWWSYVSTPLPKLVSRKQKEPGSSGGFLFNPCFFGVKSLEVNFNLDGIAKPTSSAILDLIRAKWLQYPNVTHLACWENGQDIWFSKSQPYLSHLGCLKRHLWAVTSPEVVSKPKLKNGHCTGVDSVVAQSVGKIVSRRRRLSPRLWGIPLNTEQCPMACWMAEIKHRVSTK